MKNQEMEIINSTLLQYPPLTLDLHYMLTSHPLTQGGTSAGRTLDGQRILGRAMRILYDSTILTVSGDDLRITLNPLTLDDMTKIWTTFPDKPFMASACYLVTPVRIDSTRDLSITRVESKKTEQDQILSFAIWLKDDYSKKKPIGQTRVWIKAGNIKAFKNPSGAYIFTDLASGMLIYTVNIESDFYFPEEREFDASMIRTKDIPLKFENDGPASGSINARLENASELHIDDVVEFHNPVGDIEQKKITNIEANNITISWNIGLKYDFSAKGSTVRVLKYLIDRVLLKLKPSYPFPNNANLVRGLIIDSFNNAVEGIQVKVENQIETKSDKNGEFVLYFKKITDPVEIIINGVPQPDEITLEEGKTIFLGKTVIS